METIMKSLNPDDFDEYEHPENLGSGGGGGGRKKKGEKHQGPKTRFVVQTSLRDASRANASEHAEKHPEVAEEINTAIEAILLRLVKKDEGNVGLPNLEAYIQWVYRRLNSGEKPAIESECDIEFLRTSGPGGQKRNKVETGVRLTHKFSGLLLGEGKRSSQEENRSLAEGGMEAMIEQHLENWNDYIASRKGDMRKIMVKKIRETLFGSILEDKRESFDAFCRMMARLSEDKSLDIDEQLS